ncbi:MAG: hypothetical protein SAJ12_24455, partial [Jaaginema sp. PMC 1079.18]|nr:hypothetical protein [Jaaginema sp. PMC 1079.18]
INTAQQGILALASDAGAHLQVSESGDIAYVFPQNFRSIIRNKYWRIRFQEIWQKIWGVLFYLIRISFGIILIISIILMLVAILAAVIAIYSSGGDRENNSGGNSRSGGGGFIFFPRFWLGDLFWFFDPGVSPQQRRRRRQVSGEENKLNFLEAVYSFLFGDGNPNADLDARRWQDIATVIRNSQGAITGEQIAPYFDDLNATQLADETFILPVLARFDGYPKVADTGDIIYHFPQLQVTAKQTKVQPVAPYLQESLWRFSAATTSQIILSIGLGSVNIILALVLYSLIQNPEVAIATGYLAWIQSIYSILLGYGIAFLGIPLLRHFWNQWRNPKIVARNEQRRDRAQTLLQPSPQLQQKLTYAQKFAAQTTISDQNLAYTTETDLLTQNLENADKIDQEWQRRLESDS